MNANALTNINKLIENYNQTREFLSSTQKEKYLIASTESILDNQSTFWISLDIILDENSNVSRIIMYNAIQNFNNLNRSKEEQNLVKSEITRLIIFWVEQKKLVEKAIKSQEKKVNNIYIDLNYIINTINKIYYLQDGIYYNLMRELDKISLNLEIAKNIKNKIFGQDNIQNIIYDVDFIFIEEEEENEEEENEEEENEKEENEEEMNKEEENEE